MRTCWGRRTCIGSTKRTTGSASTRPAHLLRLRCYAKLPKQAQQQQQQQQQANQAGGQLYNGLLPLLIVPALWGSYNPVVRLIYEQPHPLDPSTLTAIRTALAAAALGVAVVVNSQKPDAGATSKEASSTNTNTNGNHRNPLQAASKDLPLLARPLQGVVPAGVELGIYNFLGTSLQATGLTLTSATQAGFLVQLAAVFVPVLASFAGFEVSKKIWGAAALALTGTFLITLDSVYDSASSQLMIEAGSSSAVGNLYVMTACIFYALATVRLGLYAPVYNSVQLTAVKKFTLGAASIAWLISTAQQEQQGFAGVGEMLSQQSVAAWALVVYSSLGPGALATFLQTYGQATVPPTLAQVVFSLTPLCSAAFAFLLLGDDGMGPIAWGGSAAILTASIIATQNITGGKDATGEATTSLDQPSKEQQAVLDTVAENGHEPGRGSVQDMGSNGSADANGGESQNESNTESVRVHESAKVAVLEERVKQS